MSDTIFYHEPVLKAEVVTALKINPDGIYVDATFGGGGHSRAILSELSEVGRLIVFDQDEDAWSNAPDDKRLVFVKENFKYLKRFLKLYKAIGVDGILADLGVSSFQFDTAERGFSIRFDAQLDMRMDVRQEKTARDIIATYSERDLHQIFEKFGEVRNSKTLAKCIVEGRDERKVETINGFINLIEPCIKGKRNKYLAQVFQAIRIEVNQELEVLKMFLNQTAEVLKPGGRLCVITFHSLEDRIVKHFLKNGTFENEVEKDFFGKPIVVAPFKEIKSIVSGEEELKRNPRSRSARLRIGERKEF